LPKAQPPFSPAPTCLPHTPLADRAIAEGRIATHEGLLFPVFYVAEAVAPWLADRLRAAAAGKPHWHVI